MYLHFKKKSIIMIINYNQYNKMNSNKHANKTNLLSH